MLFQSSFQNPSDIEVEKEDNNLKQSAEESQEAWKETLASFKEQALKMQSVSQEAYDVYSEKAMIILKETSEKLKVQAEKARQELSVIAKEISEESKEYLSNAAENTPEPVKDIVETFASSTDELKDASKVRDFYLGIPYGTSPSVFDICCANVINFPITFSLILFTSISILGLTIRLSRYTAEHSECLIELLLLCRCSSFCQWLSLLHVHRKCLCY